VVLGFRACGLDSLDRRMMNIESHERFFARRINLLIHPFESISRILEILKFLRTEYSPVKGMLDSCKLNLAESNTKLEKAQGELNRTKQNLDALVKWIVMTHELAAPFPQKTILSILQESKNAQIVRKI
jgi:hypothetical protein